MQCVSTVLERYIRWQYTFRLRVVICKNRAANSTCTVQVPQKHLQVKSGYIGLAGGNTKKRANKKSWREHNSIRTLCREFTYKILLSHFFAGIFYRCGDGIL